MGSAWLLIAAALAGAAAFTSPRALPLMPGYVSTVQGMSVLPARGTPAARRLQALLRRRGRRAEFTGGLLLVAIGVLPVTGLWTCLLVSAPASEQPGWWSR